MKRLCTVILFALIVMFLSSCEKVTGDGPLVTQQRSISNFSGIDLRCSSNISFVQSNDYKVEVSAQQNIQEVLITEVVNHMLVIRYKNNVRVRSHDPVTLLISGPEFNSLRISGSGNIVCGGHLTSPNMDLDISGSGGITIPDINTSKVDANISGSGNISMMGEATDEELKISGSGNIDLLNLICQRATITISGSGDTRVNASQNLDIHISGSGSVYYKGTPVINTHTSGSGKVVHVN